MTKVLVIFHLSEGTQTLRKDMMMSHMFKAFGQFLYEACTVY